MVHQGRLGLGAEDSGELAVHLGAVEAGELDPPHGAQPVQLGQEGAQRVTAVDVVGAVGGDDDEPGGVQGAEEVAEQFAGGAVGPVQVLDDEDHRAVGGEPFQQPGGQLEQPHRAVLVVPFAGRAPAELRQEPGQFALLAGGCRGASSAPSWRRRARRAVENGAKGSPSAPISTQPPTAMTAPERAGRGEELLDQPGLADPRLTADQQRLRFPGGGAGERGFERGQLGGPTDEYRVTRTWFSTKPSIAQGSDKADPVGSDPFAPVSGTTVIGRRGRSVRGAGVDAGAQPADDGGDAGGSGAVAVLVAVPADLAGSAGLLDQAALFGGAAQFGFPESGFGLVVQHGVPLG